MKKLCVIAVVAAYATRCGSLLLDCLLASLENRSLAMRKPNQPDPANPAVPLLVYSWRQGRGATEKL